MTRWRRWLTRLTEVARGPQIDADLDDELDFHLESEAERLELEEGLSPREARRRARRDFVGVERCKEDVREARGLPALTFLGRDLKYGLRGLLRHPTFTIVAVLSLAIGIGTNVAVFSVVDATLLRPYPYDPDDRLVHIMIAEEEEGILRFPTGEQYLALKSLPEVFTDVQGTGPRGGVDVTGEDRVLASVRYEEASTGLFEMFGARPILGRGFVSADERPDAPGVTVLGFHAWQSHFGGDAAVIGRTVSMLFTPRSTRVPLTIVGVLPEGLRGGNSRTGRRTDFWLPLRAGDLRFGGVQTEARLAPGVTPERAAAAIDALLASPGTDARLVASVTPHRQDDAEPLRPTLLLLWGAVVFVLLIACANVAALTLSRAIGRTREVATRLALGASRWRIAQLLLAEGALLAVAGGTLGTLLAYGGVQGIRFLNNDANPMLAQLFPQLTDAGVDGRVLGYTLLVSLAAALLFSVAPALLGSRMALGRALQDGRRGTSVRGGRLRQALVVGQVALALVLLTGAGLLARSMSNLLAVDPGFDMDRLLTVDVTLPGDRYLADSGPDPSAFHAELVRRVAALPGVVSSSGISIAPLSHSWGARNLMFGDRPPPPAGALQRHGRAEFRVVVGDVFDTLGIPVLRGRGFTTDDRRGAPLVAVISQNMADEYWPDQDPVGQEVWFVDGEGQRRGEGPREIVGVVGDTRWWGLAIEPERFIYMPRGQVSSLSDYSVLSQDLLVRTEGPPESLVPAVRDVMTELDPRAAVVDGGARSMRELASISTDGPRFYLLLLGAFAGVGLGLALIGIYGVMSHAVTQRTHEIGIRMALGAARRQVVTLVVRQGLALGLAGVAIGGLGAWWLSRFVQAVSFYDMNDSILYDVEPRDVTTFVASAVLLLAAVLLACYGPTRRATRVDPMTVLRHE